MALVMIEGWIGMFVVETIARIRRAHFVQGKSIKAICRELRVSRKTVRKVIRSEATEFQYEREHQPMPRLGAWREHLDAALAVALVQDVAARSCSRHSSMITRSSAAKVGDGKPFVMSKFTCDMDFSLRRARRRRPCFWGIALSFRRCFIPPAAKWYSLCLPLSP